MEITLNNEKDISRIKQTVFAGKGGVAITSIPVDGGKSGSENLIIDVELVLLK